VIESRFSSPGDFIYLELYGQKNIMIIGMWLQKLATKQISSITGFNRKTIRILLNKIGRIVIPKYYASMPKLGGNNAIVEIDESKFGKRKYHRGHRVEGVWVLEMVERATERKLLLLPVPDRSAD